MYYDSCNWSMGICGHAKSDRVCRGDDNGKRLTNEDGTKKCIGFEYN